MIEKYLLGLFFIGMCVHPVFCFSSEDKSGWVKVQSGSVSLAHEDHREHKKMLKSNPSYKRTVQSYAIPDVTLISKKGEEVRLREVLSDDKPILMQFIFTTCSTICPVLSATLASVQEKVTMDGRDTHLVSISIDPEHDTPEKLAVFSKKFNANENWSFLTGQRDKIAQVQKAFDAYYPGNNKMYHQPYTYLRASKGSQWVRIKGLLSSKDLLLEYNKLFNTAMVSQ